MRLPQPNTPTVFLLLLAVLASVPASGAASPPEETPPSLRKPSGAPSYCEDFANRQINLANRLLRQSNYGRAVKVLNSTAENCDREFVREKLYEVFNEWYGAVRGQGLSAVREFIAVLDNQSYLPSSGRAQLEQRIRSQVRSTIGDEFGAENYEAAYRTCRDFPEYVDQNFQTEYYCGAAAEEVGAMGVAMNAYAWLLDNWAGNQSTASWGDVASTLKSLYLLNGRFEAAYTLSRRIAVRTPSPETILASLISMRGNFLAPLVRVGAAFYGQSPSSAALNNVGNEMDRVHFPKYIEAFYILNADGSVRRGMYGTEANAPSTSLLERASGSVSLLQAPGDSNLAWLVSPIGSRFLILEFGVATTPEETVRLENILANVESDEAWSSLYQFEFTETAPATGSAIGVLLGAAHMDEGNFDVYDEVFDDSPVLAYYCIQNDSGTPEVSYNFEQASLGYGEDEWERTSNTPALYHHSIQYSGQSVREVVWPNFVNEQWTGVVRVGLVQS